MSKDIKNIRNKLKCIVEVDFFEEKKKKKKQEREKRNGEETSESADIRGGRSCCVLNLSIIKPIIWEEEK